MISPKTKCAVCQSENLRVVNGLEKLLRVTSDSRIWPSGGGIAQCSACGVVQKVFDQALADDLDKVYSEYDLYFQGAGSEQKIFINGIGRPRSELLLDYFFNAIHGIDSRANPTCLDFGCGKGNLLRAMSKTHSNWKLFGADLSEKNRGYIEDIRGVEGYFSGGIDAVDGAYDLLSLSHVLEHISQPVGFLKSIRSHLKTDGYLLIAVPNWLENPFELLVVDHCLHFTKSQLASVVQKAGFEIVRVDEHALPKELVLVARRMDGAQTLSQNTTDASFEKEWAKLVDMAGWLASLVEWGTSQSKLPKRGLLGTALAATWLYHSCGSAFSFFVDEDADRSNSLYLGREVLPPQKVPSDAVVLAPLPSEIATKVCMRLNRADGPQYLAPPIYGKP